MLRLFGVVASAILLLVVTEVAQAAYPCGEGFTLQGGLPDGYYVPYGYYGYPYYPYYGKPYYWRRHHRYY